MIVVIRVAVLAVLAGCSGLRPTTPVSIGFRSKETADVFQGFQRVSGREMAAGACRRVAFVV